MTGGGGSQVMSRRRKYGDSPAPKNTPLKTAAAEDCGSVVEPRRRRLKSARGSRSRVAGEGPGPPVRQREQRPAAAGCSKSTPKERYETPTRMLKMDLSSTFSSPNDPDGQNDIFWDQNSPMTKQLGKGRKKQIYTTDSDEISHIVNRIAPQDEKPTANSMLGVWIGASAIPCTPSVAKGKSRVKFSCTKLKTQNREKELMKLAKQFDKNMEELDVIQEQNKRNHDFMQTISGTETLNNYKDNEQMQLLCDIIPEINNAIIKKPLKVNTRISVVENQNSSQKSVDENAEADFNAIFDGSTQKCSGRLSQDLSDASLNTSNTMVGKKSALKAEKVITIETLVNEKLPNKSTGSLSELDTPITTKSCVTTCFMEPETSSEHIDAFTTSDFEDDWGSLLDNEPFVMQNLERPEFPVLKSAQVTNQKEVCVFISKNSKSKSRTNTGIHDLLRDSKILQNLPSKTHSGELIDSGKHRVSPDLNVKSSKLPSTGNKMKFENSFNETVVEDKFQDCTVTCNLTKVKEDSDTKFTSNVNPSEKKFALNRRYSNEQETSITNTHQANASKIVSFFDDWNDPSFANEIIKTCHQLENTWESDDVDDDMLYQACDDIERLTQQQDIRKNCKTTESILEINNSSKHGTRNCFSTSKGNQVVQSKHLNLGSISLQTSSLTSSSQINKSIKVDRGEMYRNSPSFLNITTNLTMNSNLQTSNLRVPGNNTAVPIPMNSFKSVLPRSSTLNVISNPVTTEVSTYKKNAQQLSTMTIMDEPQNNFNETVRFSKYTFTRMKNSQILSQFNRSCMAGSVSDTKITQGSEKKKAVSPLLGEPDQQQSLVKYSESLRQSSKEENEKNRKYSPEEIQKKRQEALVRRMTKAQASSVNTTPTSFL